MMMKKYSIILLLIFVSITETFSQQDALYSQYMFNPFMINPAYAGSRNATSAVLLFREQWLGIDGAPSTQTFSIHSPFQKNKMALGLNISNDRIGPTRNTGGFLTYAYHLTMPKGKLSLGLRGGVYNSSLDQSMLNYQDQSDHFIGSSNVNAISPSFDFGVYYYTNKFYLGLSSTHLTQNSFIYEGLPDNANFDLKRHYMFATGYAWEISKNAVFKPSVLVKYVENAPVNVDVNASVLLKKVFWLGLSYRSAGSIVFITEYNIAEFIRLGYSYDLVTSKLKKFSGATHELFVGFDMNFRKAKSVSPRYL